MKPEMLEWVGLIAFVVGEGKFVAGAGAIELVICFGIGIGALLLFFIVALVSNQRKKKDEGGNNERRKQS